MKEEPRPLRRLNETLTTGNIWLSILSLIKKQKKVYAYVLDSELEKTFSFKPSKVMIYLVLYKLEAEGMISSSFEERRKYYELTLAGKKTLIDAKKYLASLSKRL